MRSDSRRKQYVEVLATHYIDGTVQPRTIILADGPAYQIDQIRAVTRARTPRAGEVANRYTIVIGKHETYLYEDSGRWYVEFRK